MKLIEGKLYIEWKELLAAGLSVGTQKAIIARKTQGFVMLPDPRDSRRTLIEYLPLPDRYKDLFIRKWGNPLDTQDSRRLEAYMSGKPEDIDFLHGYRVDDSRYLPKDTLSKYISAVKILHFMSLTANKDQIAGCGFKNMSEYWTLIQAYIKQTDASLPTQLKKLQKKLSAYKQEGPLCVINKRFNNCNSAKVKTQDAETVLLGLLSHGNRLDFVTVSEKYNEWAAENGLKQISSETVRLRYLKNSNVVDIARLGKKAYADKYDRTIHRQRPSHPLLLVNLDDNNLDLYFRNPDREKGKDFERVTAIVVVDVYNNYPLGYAVGMRATNDLVKAAYANAIHHIKELTGQYYLPHQTQADGFGRKELSPFYQRIGTYIPTATGNARAKRIESFFNHTWHKVLKLQPNYSGHNITRGETINREALIARKDQFPDIDQAPFQVAMIVEEIRNRIMDNNQTCREQYLIAFEKTPMELRRPLEDVKRLQMFGQVHSHKNTLTKDGLILTLEGNRIIYDIPDADYREHVFKTLNVAYMRDDLTKVLAFSDDLSVQIVCPVYEKYKDAAIEMTDRDRARVFARLREKHKYNSDVNERALELQMRLATVSDLNRLSGAEPVNMIGNSAMKHDRKDFEDDLTYNETFGNGQNSTYSDAIRRGEIKIEDEDDDDE